MRVKQERLGAHTAVVRKEHEKKFQTGCIVIGHFCPVHIRCSSVHIR